MKWDQKLQSSSECGKTTKLSPTRLDFFLSFIFFFVFYRHPTFYNIVGAEGGECEWARGLGNSQARCIEKGIPGTYLVCINCFDN